MKQLRRKLTATLIATAAVLVVSALAGTTVALPVAVCVGVWLAV